MFFPRITTLPTYVPGDGVCWEITSADPLIEFSNSNRTAICGSTSYYDYTNVPVVTNLLNTGSVYFEILFTGVTSTGFLITIIDFGINNNGWLTNWNDVEKQLYTSSAAPVSFESGDILNVWRKNNNFWFGLNGACLYSIVDSVQQQGNPVSNTFPHYTSSSEGSFYFEIYGPNDLPYGQIDLQLTESSLYYSLLSGFTAWDSSGTIVFDAESIYGDGEIVNSGLTFRQSELIQELDANGRKIVSNSLVNPKGNIYWEIKVDNISTGNGTISVGVVHSNGDNLLFINNNGVISYNDFYGYVFTKQLYFSNGTNASFVEGDIIRIWRSSNYFWFGINNVILYCINDLYDPEDPESEEYIVGDPINTLNAHWSLLEYSVENPVCYAFVTFNKHGDQVTSCFNDEDCFYEIGSNFYALNNSSGGIVNTVQSQRTVNRHLIEVSHLNIGLLGI